MTAFDSGALVRDQFRSCGPEGDSPNVLVVEQRPFVREMMHTFLAAKLGMRVVSAPSMRDWIRAGTPAPPDVVLISIADGARLPSSLADIFGSAADRLGSVPVIVMSNERPTLQILELMKLGFRGFVPTSISGDVAAQAVRLVCAGGTFLPVSCLQSGHEKSQSGAVGANLLTRRQLQVVEGIRQGKPNKIIAYELQMTESTVKVHVRAIMAKLRAKNRTQVACFYNTPAMDQTVGAP